jgi:regulator of sirC expression with transglutaminase-like and TPR domain
MARAISPFSLSALVSQTSPPTARRRFAEMVSRVDEQINLAEAALLIAAEEYPRVEVEVDLYLEKLDRFGDLARAQANSASSAVDLIAAVNFTLFEELGFRGNRGSYYDPRNSFLNEVIDRRIGIPITLTVVYIEVAKRIGFPIKGVGMPGHFIAKHEAESGDFLIDPFNDGRLLGRRACSELVAEATGGALELEPAHLAAVTNKQILTRMLSNLLGIYGTRDQSRAIAAIDRILLISPDSSKHVRDRGLLLASLGETRNGLAELDRYLELAPDAPDAEVIREQIKTIRQGQARLN